MQFSILFLDITKIADFKWKNTYLSRIQEFVTEFIFFLDLFRVRCNYVKFHDFGMYVTDFRERGFFPPLCDRSPN